MTLKTGEYDPGRIKKREKLLDILVIEDDEIQTVFLKKIFRKFKDYYNPVFKKSIKAAVNYLAGNYVHAIVSDYHLEDGLGSDLIDYNIRVPIIIITTTEDVSLVARLMKHDEIYDFVLKSFEPDFVYILDKTLRSAIKRYRLSATLDSKKSRYMKLLEEVSDVIYKVDKSWNLQFINEQVFQLAGYTALELHRKNALKLVDDDSLQEFVEFYNQQIKKRQIQSQYEFYLRTKGGIRKKVNQSAKMLLNQRGEFQGFVLVMRPSIA